MVPGGMGFFTPLHLRSPAVNEVDWRSFQMHQRTGEALKWCEGRGCIARKHDIWEVLYTAGVSVVSQKRTVIEDSAPKVQRQMVWSSVLPPLR